MPTTSFASHLLDDSFSFTGSAITTSSSSTVWGPGALSGRFLKAVGEKILDLYVRVVIRRRLAAIKKLLQRRPHVLRSPSTASESLQVDEIHADLEELCREYYPLSIRSVAINLIWDIKMVTRPESEQGGGQDSPWELLHGYVQGGDALSSGPPSIYVFEDSDDLSSLTASAITKTSSSTVWGPGALSGKFLKAIGEKTLELYVSMVIRRRLAVIKQNVQKQPHALQLPSTTSEWEQANEIHTDLEELCREYYSLSIRQAAASLIWDITMATQTNIWIKTFSTTHNRWEGLLGHILRQRGLLSELQETIGLSLDSRPRVLVLGAGGAGKSTLVERIKYAFNFRSIGASWTPNHFYREIIIKKVIASMKTILLAGEEDVDGRGMATLDLSHSVSLMDAKAQLITLSRNEKAHHTDILRLVGQNIGILWSEPSVRNFARKMRTSVLPDITSDSTVFFFNSVDRIFTPNYVPTHEDIIHARVSTTGISEYCIRLGHMTGNFSGWRLMDTSGELLELKRWIHHDCFTNTAAVLFVVALSDYNKHLYEDDTVNRMDDSLALFKSTVQAPWSANALIILLFNKVDIFAKELEYSSLKDWAPDYEGETYDDALKYIESRFINVIEDKSRPISTKYICAVDERAMPDVLWAMDAEIDTHYAQQSGYR